MSRYRGTGTYLVAVLSRGIDGEYGDNLGPSLPDALANKYGDMATKTQDQVIAMLKAMTSEAGSDDLIWMGGVKVAKADDGDGHTDDVKVMITGEGVAVVEEIIEEGKEVIEEIIEEITATPVPTPTPEPTPKPPGFEAIFAIAGLLAVAYLVHRRKN
jgi:PGF-CTERM protein